MNTEIFTQDFKTDPWWWEWAPRPEPDRTTPLPAKVYPNEGIAQVLFFQSDAPCEVSYADKKGKYQGQRGLTLPKL